MVFFGGPSDVRCRCQNAYSPADLGVFWPQKLGVSPALFSGRSFHRRQGGHGLGPGESRAATAAADAPLPGLGQGDVEDAAGRSKGPAVAVVN